MFSLSLADVPFVGSATPIQRALAVLRKFGTDAHVWLPGVGSINGLQTANYLLSDASTGLAPVDQYVGRVNDALGGLGVNMIPNSGFDTATGWAFTQPTSGLVSISGGVATVNSVDGSHAQVYRSDHAGLGFVIGREYRLDYVVTAASGAGGRINIGNFAGPTITAPGAYYHIAKTADTSALVIVRAGAGSISVDSLTVREVTGIHATQPTTANKPKLVRGAVNRLLNSEGVAGGYTNGAAVFTVLYSTFADGRRADRCQITGTGGDLRRSGGGVLTGVVTLAAKVRATTTGCKFRLVVYGASSGASASQDFTATSEDQIVAFTATIDGTLQYLMITNAVTYEPVDVLVGEMFVAQGTLTAADIIKQGGIPLTTTAPASTALGPYWWDTTGGKSLSATFPAGYESVTVIDAARTGQVTQTAQNVVGAYNITTPTHGRIVIKAAVTAPELTLLQKLANSLAGL